MRGTAHPYKTEQPARRPFGWGDVVVLLGVAALMYGGVRLAVDAPAVVRGPSISLSPWSLPVYATFSLGRMAAAYALSMAFSLVYGYYAAYNRRAERILIPLLDVLQSVPILSFLPVVLLSLTAIMPDRVAAELSSIVLIFTGQAWNIAFGWYQSLTTIPNELREASAIFRFNAWLRLKGLELPFGALSLIWNSMMSWAGGWFFLMAAEIFTVGRRDFRLPGLGAYLQEAANRGDLRAIGWGVGALVLVIVALDQFVWRPLLVWSDRFRLEMSESDYPPTSWFYEAVHSSRFARVVGRRVMVPLGEALDALMLRRFPMGAGDEDGRRAWLSRALEGALLLGLLYGALRAGQMLVHVPGSQWGRIGLGVAATFLRVFASLAIGLAWTVPVGVAIGTNQRLAKWLQPVVQVTASVPATALFPVLLLVVLGVPGGLNIAAVLLMLMGTQWYLLFNIVAGASAIPRTLGYTAALMQLSGWDRWRTLVLPALFPYIVTGMITAGGGAWNASIVAERVEFAGQVHQTAGVGALIAEATSSGDYRLLLAATLSLILTVVLINRVAWRRLYVLAEERYRME
jgi:NitT/TauT family transport system permease protein